MTEYEVSVTNTFETDTPEQAVREFIEWIIDNAPHTGYRVTWMYTGFGDTTPQSVFIDGDDT